MVRTAQQRCELVAAHFRLKSYRASVARRATNRVSNSVVQLRSGHGSSVPRLNGVCTASKCVVGGR